MPIPNSYVMVHERLAAAHDNLLQVIAEPPVMLDGAMGYIRVTIALKDGRTSTGTASFRLGMDGRSAQATNPIEDCETSAIGRALGILGYGSKDGIASQEEVDEARRRAAQPPQRAAQTAPRGDSAPQTNGRPSDKQRNYIKSLQDEIGWNNDRLIEEAHAQGINTAQMTAHDASKLIKHLQGVAGGVR
jgi:hypothetical protein